MKVDKTVIRAVLGSLMKQPSLLGQIDKYNLVLTDFSTRFEANIFQALTGLYKQGVTNIKPIDIENYISSNQAAKVRFEQNNGLEYCHDAMDLADEGNFQYYYEKLKKLNLLRDLERKGYPINSYYQEDLTAIDAIEINSKFEELTRQDIILGYKNDIATLESQYNVTGEVETEYGADGIEEFFDSLSIDTERGASIQGRYLDFMIGGAMPGTLTIRSASSGTGKTRSAVGDACKLAFPFYHDGRQWVSTGNCEKVLMIITEQQMAEVRKMMLAWISGINESVIKYKQFSVEQEVIIRQGISILQKYKENFIIVKMPNPTLDLVKTKIREQFVQENIKYVFYDYIFICPSILHEFNGFSLRNDEVLMMMAATLKDLAVEMNLAIFTSTQVNAAAKDGGRIRDEGTMQGGRATINKADNGMVMAKVTNDDLEILKEGGDLEEMNSIPNIVTDIFKVRNGAYTNVRIWSKIDLGTLKRQDLFVTDSMYNPVIINDYIEFSREVTDEEKEDKRRLERGERID